ncbi:DUF397 domain-containing protein [Streptomyces sp. ME02-8801-2C]|uniref:DUF397 domain-containing protein n=1 Tax=Streptomyces sp. ME02-8801-2C TaxID=3028680 RepID=UPI0029A09BC1|nr:DUF397 domain-containing protein [Streptomyces sp. ME02-8801-2C]MDX3453911.1 DUF397 domain-containing protein [Streptomyces sp. ME02-8801-2C]
MEKIDLTHAIWIKSSRSNAQSACVEVAFLGQGAVPVRDSKIPYGPVLVASQAAWDNFVEYIKR